MYDIIPVPKYEAGTFRHAVQDVRRFCAANDPITNKASSLARCGSKLLEVTDWPHLRESLPKVGWCGAHYRPE